MLLVSYDSKYLFSTNGSRIDVFSVVSGELVYRLAYSEKSKSSSVSKCHQNESLIKSICVNTSNKYQLLSFHLGGRVCLWDYEDGLLLKTFDTNLLIKKVLRTETNLYALGKLYNQCSDSGQLGLYKLDIDETEKNHSVVEHQLVVSNLNINEEKLLVVIDSESKYIAYVEGRKYLVINQFKKQKKNVLNKFKAKLELTCLAIHPNEDCIATGTTSGKILLWYNYLQHSTGLEDRPQLISKATKSVLHWHSLPVLSLSFTPEGSYLMSGGHECVLVKWMFRTGQTEFKPRLGAPLTEITLSKDNTLYATQHLDNTIHLIGTNMNVQQTLCGFLSPKFSTKLKPFETLYPTGLNFFPHLNSLITNGTPGHLQFYSKAHDKLLFNLDIVDENYISPENLNRPNVHTQIECLAFNHDFHWMATVERRDDFSTTPETRLKFWRFDYTTNKFNLNTLVRYPHGFDKVNRIKFKPNENILFTCGNDACFKSWALKENAPQALTNEITYNWLYNSCDGYRDLNPTNIEFISQNSMDLIAVSFNHIATIWQYDQYGLVLLNDLVHCDPVDHIVELKFIDNHLLVAHVNFLNVWSMNAASQQTLSMSPGDKMKLRCVWSHETNEVLHMTVEENNPSQVVLFIKKSQKQVNEEAATEVQIAIFSLHAKSIPSLRVIHTFNVYSDSRLHFICVKRSDSGGVLLKPPSGKEKEKKSAEFESLLNRLNVFYCDNRGILQKVLGKGKESTGDGVSNNVDFIETDLDDAMWQNRKQLKQNAPVNSLASIIDMHKSNTWNNKNLLIDSQKNERFDSNLNKIEQTPAYLLPKVSSFCFDLLKSMLHRLDDEVGGGNLKVSVVNRENSDGYSSGSESDLEEMDLENGRDDSVNHSGNKGATLI